MRERPPQDPTARALERLVELKRPNDQARALDVMKRVEAMLDSLPELPEISDSLDEDDWGDPVKDKQSERSPDDVDDAG